MSPTDYYAHSLPGRSCENWELLETHLSNVATTAAQFATEFGAADWARTTGLWHDLGKYSTEFQAYLRSANGSEVQPGSLGGRVDHSSAGAQHASRRFPGMSGQVTAYCIAGHHCGLPDNEDESGGTSGLRSRLAKTIPDFLVAPPTLLDQPPPAKPSLEWDNAQAANAAFQVSVFCRMLFSCLVDADYLATEAFMRPDQSVNRVAAHLKPADLLPHLNTYLSRFRVDTPVNDLRAKVLRPILADRLVLSLINRRQVSADSFRITESGAVWMNDATRKDVLVAYQTRKQDTIKHPILNEEIQLGLLPHVQALLLSRHIRGDIDGYPPFLWK